MTRTCRYCGYVYYKGQYAIHRRLTAHATALKVNPVTGKVNKSVWIVSLDPGGDTYIVCSSEHAAMACRKALYREEWAGLRKVYEYAEKALPCTYEEYLERNPMLYPVRRDPLYIG